MSRVRNYLVLLLLWTNVLQVFALQITGAPQVSHSETDVQPLRNEINVFAKSGPAFDLYILALQRFQVQDQNDMQSYFQIAGIHGFPTKPWDGVSGAGSYPGFCMHAAVVFPTWHRAYLALFEQTLWAHAQTVANMYPLDQRTQYQNAAATLRMPYWDWAITPGLPAVVSSPFIEVNAPEGFINISNPLYQYTFHPGPEGNGFPAGHPLASLPTTVRYYDAATQESNNEIANGVLLSNAASTLTLTYALLSSVKDYTTFSCTFPGGQPNHFINLETIHNSIHNYVGGFWGSMTWPELSAFDPIFWLHHANVDRIFAMWQALNPDTFVIPTVNGYGSFAEPRGAIDSLNSALLPFHSDNRSAVYTSEAVRDIATFSYTYPELAVNNLTKQELISHVTAQVNTLYAPRNSVQTKAKKSINQAAQSVAKGFSRIAFDHVNELGTNDITTQWSILVQVDRDSSNTSYNIDFFMGNMPSPPNRSTAKNLVGTYGQFVTHSCSREAGGHINGILTGEVSLTPALHAGMSRGYLADLSPKHVVPLLRQHLQWAARTMENEVVDLRGLSGLSIMVRSRSVLLRQCDEEFPSYGAPTMHVLATSGKPGGV